MGELGVEGSAAVADNCDGGSQFWRGVIGFGFPDVAMVLFEFDASSPIEHVFIVPSLTPSRGDRPHDESVGPSVAGPVPQRDRDLVESVAFAQPQPLTEVVVVRRMPHRSRDGRVFRELHEKQKWSGDAGAFIREPSCDIPVAGSSFSLGTRCQRLRLTSFT